MSLEELDSLVPLENRACLETKDHLDHLDPVVLLDHRLVYPDKSWQTSNSVVFAFVVVCINTMFTKMYAVRCTLS